MTEAKKEDLDARYPLIKVEIDKVLLWWREEIHYFEVPNMDTRVNAETQYATHADVYDLLSYHTKPGVDMPDDEMIKRNKQLFDMLRNDFGWKEVAEELY